MGSRPPSGLCGQVKRPEWIESFELSNATRNSS
jgi:hypothetical protein